MRSVTVTPSAGFCFGVKRAVEAAENLAAKKKHGCTYGALIHNRIVTDRLAQKGIVCVDKVSEAAGLGTLIIRSHGVGLDVYRQLADAKIDYIDLTCPNVARIHKIVEENSSPDTEIIILGDAIHPEIDGILGHCKTTAVVVKNFDELVQLEKNRKIFVQNAQILVVQTTFDIGKWQEFKKNVEKHYTNVKIFDTICRATIKRQTDSAALAAKSDFVIVLGDPHSSNSRKLFDICKNSKNSKIISSPLAQNQSDVVFVQKADELPLDYIAYLSRQNENFNIGITAGASTPAEIIKEVHSIMSEIITNDDMDIDFMAEVDKTFKRVYIGNRVKATVVSVNNTEAVVDIGTKHSGYIPADELSANPNAQPKDIVSVGDEIECIVTSINDAEGIVYLSKKRVDAAAGLEKLIKANEDNTTLIGTVTGVVKGGVIVMCEGSRVFVPASQSGISRGRRNADEIETPEQLMKKLEVLLKKEVELKIIEVNEGRGRVVGSIKAADKEKNDAVREKFWNEIEVGKKFTGEVKSMESYGVFVDLGGVDGMVHSSELTWNRIKHPKEVVSIGDKLDVYVKSFDLEKKRVSLGAKSPDDNPWTKFLNDFTAGDVVEVKIVSITPFGAFAQIIPGVDGLIHISQISLERVTNVAQVLSVGQIVEAKITEIDAEKSRVSLSMKALLENGSGDDYEDAAEENVDDSEVADDQTAAE